MISRIGFKVGDKAKIVDDGGVYSTYGGFLYSNHQCIGEGDLVDCLPGWMFGLKPTNADDVYTICYINFRNNHNVVLCVLVGETNTFIVDERFLEKVENDAVDEAEKKYLDIKTKVSDLCKKAYKMNIEYCSIQETIALLAKEEELALEEFQKACPHSYRESAFSINGLTGYECKRCGKKFSEKDRNYDR